MTFLEAAIEILRQAQGPLKVAEIADRSVKQQLLSHVGRDPETTMRNSLSGALRSNAHGGILERVRPGTYKLRDGATVPPAITTAAQERIARAQAAEESAQSPEPKARKTRVRKKSARSSERSEGRSASRPDPSTAEPSDSSPESKSMSESSASESPETATPESASPAAEESSADPVFEAPTGSGLDGVTDVALVMANAMSRLADERPELREELEAMQQRKVEQDDDPQEEESPAGPRRSSARSGREPGQRSARGDSGSSSEERASRKRRRRRRRGKKSDWASEPVITQRITARAGDSLLDKAAALLSKAGSKALHVRQISEGLAQQNVLNGEISEIERAVTAAMIADSHTHGSASRFVLRGDARYQLRGARLPEAAATAESTVRKALRVLEKETSEQLVRWLEGVGARALDALIRIYLEKESIQVVSTLASGRGMSRLIAQELDPEDGPINWLVLGVPKKASLDVRALDTELERNSCAGAMIFCMGDASAFGALADVRVVSVRQLGEWLLQSGVAVETLEFKVPVLNPWVLESIGGLDT